MGIQNKPHCLCRHEEHQGYACTWESPGGDLIGQYCTCDEYRPCPHPIEKKGFAHFGNPYCGGCAEHFKSEEDYEMARVK